MQAWKILRPKVTSGPYSEITCPPVRVFSLFSFILVGFLSTILRKETTFFIFLLSVSEIFSKDSGKQKIKAKPRKNWFERSTYIRVLRYLSFSDKHCTQRLLARLDSRWRGGYDEIKAAGAKRYLILVWLSLQVSSGISLWTFPWPRLPCT